MNSVKTIYTVCIVAFSMALWSCDRDKSTGPKSEVYVDVSVVVEDEYGRSVAGATITTIPPTQKVITDNEGRAVFENIPLKSYYFYVKRPDHLLFQQYIILDENNIQDIKIVVETEPPTMNILFPKDNNFISIYDIRFIGEGTDPEDGVLPDSSLVWYSNIDGQLGTGKEITLETLTLGRHIITLDGIDSDNKKNSIEIVINVVDYNPDSYFPIPLDAQWLYQHQSKNFSILNDEGNLERWELRNIEVTIDENNRRICTMSYSMQISIRVREYLYVISDDIEMDGGNMYVKKTTESLDMWMGNPYGNPDERLEIETQYTPRYLLLQNVLEPTEKQAYEHTVKTDVLWNYKDPSKNDITFTESFNITTWITVGDVEAVLNLTNFSNTGDFCCIPVKITQGNSVRKWWLAKGLGIVRLEYNTFEVPSIADLTITNMTHYIEENNSSQKNAVDHLLSEPQLINTHPIPAGDTPERLKKLRSILQGLAPR